jgi:hypothetical protein
MNKLIIMMTVFLLSACTSTTENTTASNSTYDENDGVICKLQTTVGSNRKRKICTTASERDQMREAAREGMLRIQKTSSTGGGDL